MPLPTSRPPDSSVGVNDFYRLLGWEPCGRRGIGGGEFACVLGQEMAGYATGELFFAAQTLGFRHSHLDTGAYSREQKNAGRDVGQAVDFLIADEPGRVILTSMVACLFARSVYTDTRLVGVPRRCRPRYPGRVGPRGCRTCPPSALADPHRHRFRSRCPDHPETVL